MASDASKEKEVGVLNAIAVVNGNDFMTNAVDSRVFAMERGLRYVAGANAVVYSEFWIDELKRLGPDKFQLLVTDGAESCKAGARTVLQQFPWMFWVWCVCHQLALWGCDIAAETFIAQTKTKAALVVALVRNYGWMQNEFSVRRTLHREMRQKDRDHHGDAVIKKLARFAATRFFYLFIVFDSLLSAKGVLVEIVNTEAFTTQFMRTQVTTDKKTKVDTAVKAIKDDGFWTTIQNIVTVLRPMYVALRTADSRKPPGGKLYWQLYEIKTGRSHVEIFRNLDEDNELRKWFSDKMAPRMKNIMQPLMGAVFMLDPRYHDERRDIKNNDRPEWMWLKGAAAEVIGKVFHESKEQYDKSISPQLRAQWEVQAGVLLDQFHGKCDVFDHTVFKGWSKVKADTDVARWASMYMSDAMPLQYVMMKVLSLVFSSSAAERNFSAWNNVWSDDRAAMTFENARDRVYMYTNQRSMDAIAAEAFSPDFFLHVGGDDVQDPLDYEDGWNAPEQQEEAVVAAED